MNIEVISSGTELLRGDTVNSDLAMLGRELAAAGMTVSYAHTAGDDAGALTDALAAAAKRADIIVITGGLGSTDDDITRIVTAGFFGLELLRDEPFASYLRYLWRSRHGAGGIPKAYFRQADRIAGAEFMRNEQGSAPGQYFQTVYAGETRHIFLLPGPPAEFQDMAAKELLPRLKSLEQGEKVYCQGCLVPGKGELEVQTLVRELLPDSGVNLSYCAVPEGTRLFLSGSMESVSAAMDKVQCVMAGNVLKPGCLDLAQAVVELLRERGLTFGLAESCTGGLISGAVTAVPGSSAVFMGGIVSYANEVKNKLLNVPQSILAGYGAVSSQCAEAMAAGAKKALGVSIAGSVTGIAGPDGGTAEKPVGTVFSALALPDGQIQVTEHHFRGSRSQVREKTKAAMLLALYIALR